MRRSSWLSDAAATASIAATSKPIIPAGTIWLTGVAGPEGREARVIVKATDVTLLRWPRSVAVSARVAVFQSLMVWSPLPLASVQPEGAKPPPR